MKRQGAAARPAKAPAAAIQPSAALEAFGVQWQSMLAQAKAKGDFESKLRALWNEQK